MVRHSARVTCRRHGVVIGHNLKLNAAICTTTAFSCNCNCPIRTKRTGDETGRSLWLADGITLEVQVSDSFDWAIDPVSDIVVGSRDITTSRRGVNDEAKFIQASDKSKPDDGTLDGFVPEGRVRVVGVVFIRYSFRRSGITKSSVPKAQHCTALHNAL